MASSRVLQSHDSADLSSASWPIAASMLPFPATGPDGTPIRALGAKAWSADLAEVSQIGFNHVEITDTWLRAGDLTPSELEELAAAAATRGLKIPAVALIRRSILDPQDGRDNLSYSHRSLDAAAALGARVVSVGLHEPLTPAQQQTLWFWTQPGAVNDPADPKAWKRAVDGLRELGQHAHDLGLLLSLELYEDTYLGTAAQAVRLVRDIGLNAVGLNLDLGNLVRLHRPVEQWPDILTAALPWTNYWHVKNYQRDEDPLTGQVFAVPTTMRDGIINYRSAVRQALAAGFAGVFTCEHYGGDGLGVSAENRRYLQTLLPAREPSK